MREGKGKKNMSAWKHWWKQRPRFLWRDIPGPWLVHRTGLTHHFCIPGHDPFPCTGFSKGSDTTCTVCSHVRTHTSGLWSLRSEMLSCLGSSEHKGLVFLVMPKGISSPTLDSGLRLLLSLVVHGRCYHLKIFRDLLFSHRCGHVLQVWFACIPSVYSHLPHMHRILTSFPWTSVVTCHGVACVGPMGTWSALSQTGAVARCATCLATAMTLAC